MNELQRAEYLSALGVPSYMPRFVLPLAPEPRQAELPAAGGLGKPAPSRGAESLVPSEREDVEKTAEASRALIADLGMESASSQSPVPSPQSPQTEPAPKPFILSCWWLGEELLAIDSREPGAALPVESLFNNIARALHWYELPREQDRMRWPLAENRFGPAASAAEARDTCASWLEAASARRPVKSIWLMGQQAQDFCAPVEMAQAVNDWNGIRVIAMPSLSQLLQQPERKRDLWQLLRQSYPEQTRAR